MMPPSSNSKIKVLYFYNGSSLGGAPLSLLQLIRHLDTKKFHPQVFCLYDSKVIPFFKKYGVETFVSKGIREINHTTAGWYPLYNPIKFLQFLKLLVLLIPSIIRTKNIVKAHKANLVHLNSLTLLPSAIGAKLAGVPIVWHIRESVVQGHIGLRKYLLKLLVNLLSDHVIYICQDNLKSLGSKGSVVYNSIDFQEFNKDISGEIVREELALKPPDKIILMLGGIGRIKGTLELIKAISIVKKQIPTIRCIIAGCLESPPWVDSKLTRLLSRFGVKRYTQQVNELITTENLQENILLLPFRNDVPNLIAASNMVTFPSIQPHFARPIMEAGAMSKPVVASSIGGITEILSNKRNGLLVAPKDSNALAQAFITLIKNESLAKKIGAQGYQKALELFDSKINIPKTMGIYENILKIKTSTSTKK